MAELAPDEQRDLIAEHVDKARINWAHVGIACLIQAGYVGWVLTTNFDPLVARACALLGEFPAVYDFGASTLLNRAGVPARAVFHLHGQHTGFVLMSTKQDVETQSERLGPLFEDAGSGRVWIVVGYSGENDPVFDHLAKAKRFDNFLYWVGYDAEPAKHVAEQLLVPGHGAFFVGGHDADSFFVRLAQELGVFPPDLLERPFSHLDRTLQTLTEFSLPGQKSPNDVTRTPRQWIQRAIKHIEVQERSIAKAQRLLMAGDYEGVVALRRVWEETPAPELADALSWAYVMQGYMLYDQATTKTGEQADRLFAQAGEKYQAALAIKPDQHEALYNWGNALSAQALTETGEQADRLFAQAGEKYYKALLGIKPPFRHEESRPVSGDGINFDLSTFSPGAFACSRILKGQELLVVVNTAANCALSIFVIVEATLNPIGAIYRILFSNQPAPQAPGAVEERVQGTVTVHKVDGTITTGPVHVMKIVLKPSEIQILAKCA